jgi:uncharacterized protein with GYD domain
MKMPKYIVFGKFTSQGIMNIKDSPKRLKDGGKVMESLGAKLKKFYYTMGRYDWVAIFEAPDENAMTLALLTIGSLGNVSTETLTAIPADKAAEIIGKIP